MNFEVPKRVKNAQEYVRYMPIERLEELIRQAKDEYYNGTPMMSDTVFDAIEAVLRKRAPKSPVLKEVGAPVREKNVTVKKMGKVKLPYYMGSLDKVKPDNVMGWLLKHYGDCVITDKLDGNSLELVASKNKWNIYSRGNGTHGQDLSHLAPYLKLPKPINGIALRAEAILTKQAWKVFEDEAENARNFVSGLLNRKTVNKKAAEKLDVVAFQIFDSELPQSMQLKKLKKMGFKIPYYSVMPADQPVEASYFIDLLEIRREKSIYEVDGLVLTIDRPVTPITSGNPKDSVAFKAIMSDQIATVKVVDVLWKPSRHGALKPRIQIEKVKLGGVTITYMTGFNAAYIATNQIGPGAILKIVRSGDVIPHIIEVVKQTKAKMPDRAFEWNDTNVDIFIPKNDESYTVATKRINHFFRTIGVEHFSQGWVNRFYDDGLNSIYEILNASVDRYMEVEGMGDKMANKIKDGIDHAVNGVELHILMYASGTFPKSLGSKKLKLICNDYPDILSWESSKEEISAYIYDIPGFSFKTADDFAGGLPKFKKFCKSISGMYEIRKEKKMRKKSNSLDGEAVLFTGFRDKDLEQSIAENGGEVKSSMSSKVNILLVKDINTTSSKARKARDMGITIMTADQFRNTYGL